MGPFHHRVPAMTVSSLLRVTGRLLVAVLVALPMRAALAQQQTPPSSTRKPSPPPAPVYVPPPPNAQFNASMRQQQVRDQLQKNQLEEQLRQSSVETQKRPSASDPAYTSQLDQASRAQNQIYRARQQDLIDRYQSAVTPAPVTRARQPASSRSGG
jgi:hypothetical protein